MLLSSLNYIMSFNASGYQKREHLMPAPGPTNHPLHIVITGASRGIGKSAADEMRGLGHRVTGLSRSSEPTLDLGDLDAIRNWAQAQKKGSIDVLIHNAGAMLDTFQERWGMEATWAHHVAGPFLLTELLIQNGAFKKGARIIVQTSGGLYLKKLDLTAPYAGSKGYNKYMAYANAKRAQLILTHLWNKKYTDIHFSCTHPGWVKTKGVRSAMPWFYKLLGRRLRTPEQGARSLEILALSKEPKEGFWFDGERAPDHLFKWTKESPEAASRLYETLSELL